MRLSGIGAVAFMLMGVLIVACNDPVTRNPMGPAQPSVTSLQVTGPSTIPPGQSAQYVADIRLSNGTVKSSLNALNVRWRTSNALVLQISDSGLATAGPTTGEATITAEVLPTANPRGTRDVVIGAEGTYRVTGSVREADSGNQAIPGARVEVPGTPAVTTTDGFGNYRLYGVPPVATIQVTANGYQPAVQNVQLSEHVTRNFLLALSGPRITLNGLFTLTIDASGTCAGNPSLSSNLQRRTYEATATTTGSSVDVRLTEPRFFFFNNFNPGNRFNGRTNPAGVTFSIFSFYASYYTYYPSVAERLSDNTVLVPSGVAATSLAGGGVSGTMSGLLRQYDSRFPAFNSTILGNCSSSGFQFALTPR